MSGPLSLVGAPGVDGALGAVDAGPRRRRVPSWAVGDPVEELAGRLSSACASAVHPDEIAALLESEGLTDEQITGHYGHRDLFSLAAELFATVPRAFPEPEPGPDPWRTDVWRCVLRGLTFALPGVAYVLGGRWAAGPDGMFGVSAAVAGWGAAALVSWGWNQALAHHAGLLLLAQRPRTAARGLLGGAFGGALLATAAAACVAGPPHPAALAFAFGQSVYMAAATVLLVLGREHTLLYVLAPLTVSVVCGAGGLPSTVIAVVLAATVAAATAAAAGTALNAAGTLDPPPAGGTPTPALLRRRATRPASGPQPGLGARVVGAVRRRATAPAPAGNPGAGAHVVGRRRAAFRRWPEPVPRVGEFRTPSGRAEPGVGRGYQLRLPLRAFRRRGDGASSTGRWPRLRLWVRTFRRRQDGGRPAGRWSELRSRLREFRVPEGGGAGVSVYESVPLGVAGVAAGGLIVTAALAGEFVAALTVSMGVAEWLLFRFRSRCLVALRGTGVHERLLARSWRVLARCLGGYAATLAGLSAVQAAALPDAAPWDAAHVGVLLALGCTLWLALLLQSCGRPWTAAGLLSTATATAVTLLAVHAAAPDAVLGLVGAGAAAALLVAAATVTSRVTTHR